jgi:hypothetical protein
LYDEVEVIKLPWRTFVPLLLEGVCDWLMIGEYDEVTRFQHGAEMLHGFVYSPQFAIVRAVLLLGWVQLPREEGEGLLGVVDTLLQHSTHGSNGGVRDECKRRGRVGVRQEGCP